MNPMDELDDKLRDAMRALGDQTPARYFDELPGRIEARLEERMQSDAQAPADLPAKANPAKSEDSGLHDIRELAQTTKRRISQKLPAVDIDDPMLSSSSSGLRAVALPEPARMVSLPMTPVPSAPAAELAATGSTSTSAPVPVAAPRKRPGWVVGAAVAAAAAAVAAGVVIGRKSGAADKAAAGTAALTETARAPRADLPVPTAPVAAPPAQAAAPDGQVKAEPAPAKTEPAPAAGRAEVKAAAPAREAKAEKPAPAAKKAEAAAPAPAPVKAKPADGTRTLDDLLNDASGGASGGGDSGGGARAEAKPAKKDLDRSDIKTAMGSVQGQAQACRDQFGVAGTVAVKVVVAPSGPVTKVTTTGSFAGTPTGDCVAAAVRDASFPSWEGAPMTIQYSFLLSE